MREVTLDELVQVVLRNVRAPLSLQLTHLPTHLPVLPPEQHGLNLFDAF